MGKTEKNRKAVVASQIKDAMVQRGMSRKQLAQAVGRTPSEVTKWLSGNHNFTIDLLSAISEALEVQITGVAEGSDKLVAGYGESGLLMDPACMTWNQGLYSVGPIFLPKECFDNLERRAVQRGEELGAYVKDVLLKEAAKPAVSVWDFCGIYGEGDFDIMSHRTAHGNIEEI